ncbi:NADH-ubiquinone oxidoreductase 12 kda subunit mitochondrial precursor [Exidia glandulosa HHB12029]|uniref:NADH-ubiquinone oxidoreductase 12 kDa subunit mitochondrial n=1 Tax=Exidia glandulosa HHB12029 TaxID=1314781 RepID=A0A166BNK0_EXIGL|nr:NADH-ubiquinone oxidoreductase 12 kda subunit mitochondrial precursor [Exidia glandulosa HHB12029]
MSVPKPEDLKVMLEARDNHVREQWIKAMEVRLVREELDKCQRGEGVNAHVHCKELADRYLTMLADAKVKGWRIVDTQAFKE